MGIKLSTIGKKQATTTVEYYGDTVDVVYRPGAMTTRREALQAELEGSEAIEELVKQLSDVLVSWDVLGDDGKPLEPTPETLMDLPNSFLAAVMYQIREESLPKGRKLRR